MKPGKPDEGPAKPLWSVPVPVADVSEAGRRLELAADEATRTAIAAAGPLVALSRLEAVFELNRHGRDGIRVTGHISATVTQACVVSLEPVESPVEELVEVVFVPPRNGPAKDSKHKNDDTGAIDLEALDAPDPPEMLCGDSIDLGAVAIEFLLLGLDPYPRKPGATFAAPPAETPGPHPFAALAALKKDS